MAYHYAIIHRRLPGRHDGTPIAVCVFRSTDFQEAKNKAGAEAHHLSAGNDGTFTVVPVEANGDAAELTVRWACDANGLWRIDAVTADLDNSGPARGIPNVQRVPVFSCAE